MFHSGIIHFSTGNTEWLEMMMEKKEHTKFHTPYPNIVKIEGICGGEATIDKTRIAVWHVVEYYYKVGLSVEEILADWDYLTPAQVFSALAYYHDNRDEIDHLRQINSYERYTLV
jgi:uncharacterized protein (DUF433 family)